MDYLVRANNHAKSLIDFALHDLKGKIPGVPACELLGGRTTETVKMGWVVSAPKLEHLVQRSVDALRNGFAFVKVKVGVNKSSLKDDVARIAAVREAIGDDAELQIDPNGAWTYNQALENLRALDKYNIGLVEQPIGHWDVEGLARLRTKIGIPVFADESANDPMALLPLIERKAVDELFLKVSKVGGMVKAHRWLTIAEAAGLRVHCGCMVGSGIEAAAFMHVLGAHAWSAKFVHENIGPLITHSVWNTVDSKIANDLALNIPRYENGFGFLPNGPGLGVDLNEDMVRRYATPGMEPLVINAKTAARLDGYRT